MITPGGHYEPGHGWDHDHADRDTLTVGCAGCIARVKHDQARALIIAAPKRRCTFLCIYYHDDLTKDTTLKLVLKVPEGWGYDEVIEEYEDRVSSAFFDGLPPSWSEDELDEACETMWVEDIKIGPVIPDVQTVPVDEPSLFGGGA